MNDIHFPASLLPALLTSASLTPFNTTTHPLLRRSLIDQLLDNAMLSTTSTRAIGKSRTTTHIATLQIRKESKL